MSSSTRKAGDLVTIPAALFIVALVIGLFIVMRWSLGQSESRSIGLLGLGLFAVALGLLWGRLA